MYLDVVVVRQSYVSGKIAQKSIHTHTQTNEHT